MRLPGSGGALVSRLFAKSHPTRTPTPDDAKSWRMTRGGRGRDTEAQRDLRRGTPQGTTGIWVQAKGGKGGSEPAWGWQQTQTRGTGRMDERWRLAGGGCGRRPGGRRFPPGEEVGSG